MDKTNYLQPREYEMMAILLPDQPEEETKAAIDAVLGYITEQSGTIDSVNADSPWGRRRLAYTIRHEGVDYRDGHYVLVYFTAMPSALVEIERELKLDVNVIRYLMLIHDPEMGEQIDENAVVAEDAEEAEDTATESDEAAEDVAEEAPAETEDEAPTESEEEVAAEEEEAPAAEAETEATDEAEESAAE